MTQDSITLDETIHQPTRLRIMTMLVSQPDADRITYGFVQKSLGLTGGNLTTHLRKLEDAEYLQITKEFHNQKPRTWIQATPTGRQAFAEYYTNLQKVLNWNPPAITQAKNRNNFPLPAIPLSPPCSHRHTRRGDPLWSPGEVRCAQPAKPTPRS